MVALSYIYGSFVIFRLQTPRQSCWFERIKNKTSLVQLLMHPVYYLEHLAIGCRVDFVGSTPCSVKTSKNVQLSC